MKYRIRTRLTTILVLALLTGVLVIAAVSVKYCLLMRNETIRSYQNLSIQIVEQIKKSKEEIENISYQVSYSKSVQDYLMQYDDKEKYLNLPYIEENLNYMISANTDIFNIKIYDKQGGKVASLLTDFYPMGIEIDKEVKKLWDEANSEGVHKGYYCYKKESYFTYLLPIYSVKEKRGIGEIVGICRILYDLSSVQRMLDTLSLENLGELTILDSDGIVIAATDTNKIGKRMETNEQKGYFFESVSFPEEELIVSYGIPYGEILRNVPDILILFLSICLFFIVLVFGVSIFLIRNISDPISKMVEEIEKVSFRNGNYRLKEVYGNELDIIVTEINKMLNEIENLNEANSKALKDLLNAEIIQKQTELSYLRMQINPHFLYNSLECIKGMALSYGACEIESIATSLSKLYRYALTTEKSVTLEDEMNCVREYCNIMSKRKCRKYELMLNVPDQLKKKYVMSMLLQPIVENCFTHGFKSGKGNLIKITAKENEDCMEINIEDDGIGLSKDALSMIQNNLDVREEAETMEKSIGLQNIHKRIQLQYGKDSGLILKRNETNGITVIVIMNKK